MGASINFEHNEISVVFDWISELVKKLNYTGQIAFDFIKSNDGKIYVIECNPRLTSGIHLFNNTDIVDAFLSDPIKVLKPKENCKYMLALAMLVYGLPSAIFTKKLKEWLQVFCSAKDVIWESKDPLPFIHQFFLLFDFVIIAIKNKIKIIEVSTMDIEWNGEL
jgi:hypothetical protein